MAGIRHHKDLTGNDLHVNKLHAETHLPRGTDPVRAEFDVKHYGAIGNGTHDDTSAIQAAIDAAHVDGSGTVVIPNGSYLVTDTIVLYAGISVIGNNKYPSRMDVGVDEEPETTILFTPTSEKDLFDIKTNIDEWGYIFEVHLSGMLLLGNTTGGVTYSRYALNSGAAQSIFENLGIQRFQDGIFCNYSMTNKYRDIYIGQCSHACIYTSLTDPSTTEVFDNVIMRQSPWGAILPMAADFRFVGCLFEDLTTGGVNVYKGSTVEFISSYCERVPATSDGDNYAMFYVNHDGALDAFGLGYGFVSINGMEAGGAFHGSFLDVDAMGGNRQLFLSNLSLTNYTNGIKASVANTPPYSIWLTAITFTGVVNPYVNMASKLAIPIERRDVVAPTGIYDIGMEGEIRVLPDAIYACAKNDLTWSIGGTALNLLTENQSNAETDTTGWVGGFGTLTRNTTTPIAGTGDFKLVVTDVGQAYMRLTAYPTVVPGKWYAFQALVRTEAWSLGRAAQIGVVWYRADGVTVVAENWGTPVATLTTASLVTLFAQAPALGERARLYVQFANDAAPTEILYTDSLMIAPLYQWKKVALVPIE